MNASPSTQAAGPEGGAPGQRTGLSTWSGLTVGRVNLLYLVVLVLVLGTSVFVSLPTTWMLIIREVAIILGPALVFLKLVRLPFAETVRWRWPGVRIAGLSLLIGAGVWLVDTWLGATATSVLGYTIALPPDLFPRTAAQAAILVVALTMAAPIGEEALFRGIIQRGYEQRGARTAILVGGILFVVFHQSLVQGLGLIPLAFVLGYVAWRSDSLVASILAHAGNNLLAALTVIIGTRDAEWDPGIGTWPAALLGAAIAGVGLWLLHRWTLRPIQQARTPPRPGLGPLLSRAWPLILAAPIYVFVVAVEVTVGLFPEVFALGQTVELADPPWTRSVRWTYEVRNVADEPVGKAVCSVHLEGAVFRVECSHSQSPYEVDTGHGLYVGGNLEERFTALWERDSLRLRSLTLTSSGDAGGQSIDILPAEGSVQITIDANGTIVEHSLSTEFPSASLWQQAATSPTVVLELHEWPWRLSALPFASFYSAQGLLVKPYTWRAATDDQGPVAEPTHVLIYGAEPVGTPMGVFVAWRVRVGEDLVAWYDTESPHTLLAIDNGVETWVLTSTEPTPE